MNRVKVLFVFFGIIASVGIGLKANADYNDDIAQQRQRIVRQELDNGDRAKDTSVKINSFNNALNYSKQFNQSPPTQGTFDDEISCARNGIVFVYLKQARTEHDMGRLLYLYNTVISLSKGYNYELGNQREFDDEISVARNGILQAYFAQAQKEPNDAQKIDYYNTLVVLAKNYNQELPQNEQEFSDEITAARVYTLRIYLKKARLEKNAQKRIIAYGNLINAASYYDMTENQQPQYTSFIDVAKAERAQVKRNIGAVKR